jgi:hypothetical protein
MNQTMDRYSRTFSRSAKHAKYMFQSMHAIKELKTIQDLLDHQLLGYNDSGRQRLYLYQFIRDTRNTKRGTLDIGEFHLHLWTSDEESDNDSTMRYYTNYIVLYQMKPGQTRFIKYDYANYKKMCEIAEFFKDVRVFYLGDIGYEISQSVTPEQVANKYFGSSDFSTIFSYISNRADFNRRKSLEYAAKMGTPLHAELAVAKTVPLLGTHHRPDKSTVQKYWDATKQSMVSPFMPNASTSSRLGILGRSYSLAAATGLAMNPTVPKKLSAALAVLSVLPTAWSIYNKKEEIDSRQKQMQEVPESERHELLTKGALSAKLINRLSQSQLVGQRDKKKMVVYSHGRVHSHKSNTSGGSKKSKTRKTRKTRKICY